MLIFSEYLGLRIDGRRANELRKITCKTNVIDYTDGSAYFEQGNTKILVGILGPREAKQRSASQTTQVTLNVEFLVSPFSSVERKKRSKYDRRSVEIATSIKQTFEHVIIGQLFPRSQIDIFIHLLQQDGGVLEACINATCLALIDAGIPMTDYVCAINAGYVDDSPMLDLNMVEEASFDTPNITIAVLIRSGKICLLQLESTLAVDLLAPVLELAKTGCKYIHSVLDSTIKESTQSMINSVTL
ncbi:hypothetical protein BB560_006831 [Smittium megazygosporum]|uniref:Ribosomal RNA-processing protein 41 n=1 Tax=Smittium megazygosporum TaxID=133381 RepID=A0A2T9Y072_9FUNG|nr:hypothetical protein BB560_006937 [Smittium megazygosporum]PVU86018.1 hypothetical protein BB560_006831 [Smittium megazygosporum]